MELQRLKYFVTVIENSSFSHAASILHISQPSLSMAIKKLEEDSGLKLVNRTTRVLSATEEGLILYHEAKKLLKHHEYIINMLDNLKLNGPLHLTIGIIHSAKHWLQDVISLFMLEFPHVHFTIRDVISTDDVETALNNFEINLLITNHFINSKDIETVPLYNEKFVAVIPIEHPLKVKEKISIPDLEKETLIIGTKGLQSREDILNAFHQSGVKPHVKFEVERFEIACDLVERNFGITFVPSSYTDFSKKHHYHIKEIQNGNVNRMVYLAYNKNRYIPPVVSTFIDLIKQTIKDRE